MNVFIDVDYTLIAANGSLRPHARELFIKLRDAGHRAWVWSGMGERKEEMMKLGIDGFVTGYLVKPLDDFEKGLRRISTDVRPDLIVDDHAEIVEALGGVKVKPYFFADDGDRELRRAAAAILEFGERGECGDPAFHPPPQRVRASA